MIRTARKFECTTATPPSTAFSADRADDMAVAMRLEDVGAPDGEHAIQQHPARRGIHHALPHPRLMVGAADDQVAARIGEQLRPFLQPVLVDAFGVVADQLVDAEADGEVVHAHSPISVR